MFNGIQFLGTPETATDRRHALEWSALSDRIKQVDADGAPATLQPLTLEQFENADVLRFSDGENDGADWLALYLLPDGRYVIAAAGCDCSGWDCQAGGWAVVSESLPDLVRWGMTEEVRQRLGFT